ncbi:MAG: Zn-ribbon domain-containing OB-fold protein [Candidatus Micrarchaeia archaeon]
MKHPLPLIWRMIPEKYYIMGSHCSTCKNDFFPFRQICPNCRRLGKVSEKRMPPTGTIYSFTEVSAPPSGFEFESPYPLAIIELDNKVKILAQIVDCPMEKIKIGSRVTMRFRRVGDDDEESAISYGYKFALIEDSASASAPAPSAKADKPAKASKATAAKG